MLAPAFLVLYDLVAAPDRGAVRLWRLRGRYAALLAPLALYVALRLYVLGAPVPAIGYVPYTRRELFLNAVALLPQYARAALWPFDLNFYHDFEAVRSAADPRFLLGALLAIGGVLAFARARRHHPPLAFGIGWTAIALAPHLLIRRPQLGNIFAERYLYDAVGLCAVAAWGWRSLFAREEQRPGSTRAAFVAGAGVAAVFLATDARRTLDYRDEVTLFCKTLAQSRRAEVIRVNLAVDFLRLGRYGEGIDLLEGLPRIEPDYRGLWSNLGMLYLAAGRNEDAAAALEKAIRAEPRKTSALLNLGYAYDQTGKREQAVETYFRLLAIEPRNADAWYNLSATAFDPGQLENARAAAQRVLKLSPDDAGARGLLRVSTLRGRGRACRARPRADAAPLRGGAADVRRRPLRRRHRPAPHRGLARRGGPASPSLSRQRLLCEGGSTRLAAAGRGGAPRPWGRALPPQPRGAAGGDGSMIGLSLSLACLSFSSAPQWKRR